MPESWQCRVTELPLRHLLLLQAPSRVLDSKVANSAQEFGIPDSSGEHQKRNSEFQHSQSWRCMESYILERR